MLSLIKTESPDIFREIELFIRDENRKLACATTELERILIKHRIADAKLFLTGLRLVQSGA
jgi:hypothetical protein